MQRRDLTTRLAFFMGAALITPAFSSAPASAQDKAADVELLAQNIYHEARQGGREAMIAAGWVVINRTGDREFPDSIRGVIEEGKDRGRCQWGWLCDSLPDGPGSAPGDREAWELARDVAEALLSASPPKDPTGGAIWMMESWRTPPGWLRNAARRTTRIGGNAFYARR